MKELKQNYHKLSSHERLYQCQQPIIALTGGIGTGKSTVTKILQSNGLEVIDADKLVKGIYRRKEVIEHLKDNYPQVIDQDKINFTKLRELFFHTPKVKADLEKLIYAYLPLAFQEEASKIKDQNFYIYDVPLLFEKNLEKYVDISVVVYAPREIQLARILKRDDSEEETVNEILNQQMDIETKKTKSDYIIANTSSLNELEIEVEHFLRKIIL